MGFDIDVVRGAVTIIAVTYPEKPTATDINEYATRIKQVIDDEHDKPWCCLVDQSKLRNVLPKYLIDRVSWLNQYASQHGMQKSARIVPVSTPVSDLQTQRIALKASVNVRLFQSREEALVWLNDV